MSITIGVDIGGTNIRFVACNEKNEILAKSKTLTENAASKGDVFQTLTRLLEEFLRPFPREEIQAVGIGFPSTLNRDRTEIVSAPNAGGFNHITREKIAGALGLPVFFEKDAAMLLYNDQLLLDLDTSGIVVAIYIGTGIGNAIMINGHLIVGKNGVAGELGHIPCMDKTRICGCGNIGCLEEYGGGKALERIVKESFKEDCITETFTKYGNEDAVRKFVEYMALAIATEVNILDPDTLIIGGGVVNMKDFPKPLLEACVRKFTRKPLPCDNLNMVYSTNDEYGGARGAAVFARKQME